MIAIPQGSRDTQQLRTMIRQAGWMAYGREATENDYTYWVGDILSDPNGWSDYWWKRLLGWEAGGADVALYGDYASQPGPFFAVPGDTPTPVPQPSPTPTPTPAPAGNVIILDATQRIDNIGDRLTAIENRLSAIESNISGANSTIQRYLPAIQSLLPLLGGLGGLK